MAVENGIFLSTEQRSIYNEKNLRANPWWSLEETGYESELKVYRFCLFDLVIKQLKHEFDYSIRSWKEIGK